MPTKAYIEQPAGRIPKPRRALPLLPLLGGLVVVLVIVNLAVVILRHGSAQPATTSDRAGALPAATPGLGTTPAATQAPGRPAPRFGVFVGSEPQAVAAMSAWLRRPIQDVVDFGGRENWQAIADPSFVLKAWKGTRYRLIYAVPMLPDSLAATKVQAMANGADGDYDQYFKQLATRLVAGGRADAVLRIGWEMNLTSWAWGIEDHTTFVKYFRHIVTVMRSVPGAKFDINWNPNNGFNPYDAVNYWPGNQYVDSVGIDAYDVDRNRYPYPKNCNETCKQTHQQTAWDEVIYGGPRGLSFWAQFAEQHNKPFSLPEFSMWTRFDKTGGGDDPFFLTQMQFFINAPANNVSFAAYFDRDSPDGIHELTTKNFPLGRKAFRKLFGA